MLVTSVACNLHIRVVLHNIFKTNMKVSSMLVINVTIKLHNRVI